MQNLGNSTIISKYQFGELASIGLRSHYVLGKNVQAKYSNFFNHYFQADEILIRSTGWNRTIMSAKAHIEGIFDSFKEQPLEFNKEDWQVLPDMFKNEPKYDLKNIDFDTPLPNQSSP